jgi:hypothetical protein
MKILNAFIAIGLLIGCKDTSSKSDLDFKEELSKPLNEISGITADGTIFGLLPISPRQLFIKLIQRERWNRGNSNKC